MRLPTLTLIMTLHDREPKVMQAVFDSLKGQDYDQMIVVLDKPHAETHDAFHKISANFDVDIIDIERAEGWLCPARAWNKGFEAVESELTYCISSETIQAEGNILKAKQLLAQAPAALFGKCQDTGKKPVVTGRDPGLLCGTRQPRPLGFIMCIPTWAIRNLGGYDEGFMDGYGWEDDDFAFRLWRLGLPFIFDDSVSGLHQQHPRKFLNERDKVEKNRLYCVNKWKGHFQGEADPEDMAEHPWHWTKKLRVETADGRVIFFPAAAEGMMEYWKLTSEQDQEEPGNRHEQSEPEP